MVAHVQLFYSKLPKGIADMSVILVDPMLGTGGSSKKAIEVCECVCVCVCVCMCFSQW